MRRKSRVGATHVDKSVIARIQAGAADQMARNEIIRRADRDGDSFAFQVGDRLKLRARNQRVERSSQGQANQPHRRSGNAAAQDCAGAERVVDFAGLKRADGQRRTHRDDFRIETVLAIETALLGGPGIEKAQGLGRNGDANSFHCRDRPRRRRRSAARQQWDKHKIIAARQ